MSEKLFMISALYLLGWAIDILRMTGDPKFKKDVAEIVSGTSLPKSIAAIAVTIGILIRGFLWPKTLIEIPTKYMKKENNS